MGRESTERADLLLKGLGSETAHVASAHVLSRAPSCGHTSCQGSQEMQCRWTSEDDEVAIYWRVCRICCHPRFILSSPFLQFHGNSWKKVLKWVSFMSTALYGAFNISNRLFKLISKDLAISKPPFWLIRLWLGPLKFTGGLSLIGTLRVIGRDCYGSLVSMLSNQNRFLP